MTNIESLRLWSGKDITEFPNYDTEIKIPAFVNENHHRRQQKEWHEHNEKARIGAAVGTAKKQSRQLARAERSRKECILFLVGAALMLLLVGAIG